MSLHLPEDRCPCLVLDLWPQLLHPLRHFAVETFPKLDHPLLSDLGDLSVDLLPCLGEALLKPLFQLLLEFLLQLRLNLRAYLGLMLGPQLIEVLTVLRLLLFGVHRFSREMVIGLCVASRHHRVGIGRDALVIFSISLTSLR